MDSKTTSSVVPDPLTATLHNATIDKADRNEFSNTARDMFKIVLNYHQNSRSAVPTGAGQAVENPVSEFHDAINYLLSTVPIFIEEVRKNDQSRSTVAEKTVNESGDLVSQALATDHTPEGNPVDILDLVPSEPFSLPVASVADRYTRSMLTCLAGYPLYEPQPFSELSNEYVRHGISVGDVGFVRGSGIFDFLFNVCSSTDVLTNPPNLPGGFTLESTDHSTTRVHLPKTCLFQSPVIKTRSGEYICEGSEGAVLELPKGAVEAETTNTRPFAKLAARHGVQWYEYTMNRGRDISNGSLYLITSSTKCDQWGIAVFDRPCAPGQGLKYDKKRSLLFGKSTSDYRWKGSDIFSTKVSNPNQGDVANQCVFVRGYKIMIRQDIFDNLNNDQPSTPDSSNPSLLPQAGSSSTMRQRATRIRGGGGPDPVSRLTGAGQGLSQATTATSEEEVVLHPNFNSSLLHPSDLINAALLSQNPSAKIALTHDDVWCNLLRGNFPKLDYATLVNVARSYTNTIEHDCVSLKKISDPVDVFEESSRSSQATGVPFNDLLNIRPHLDVVNDFSVNSAFSSDLPLFTTEEPFYTAAPAPFETKSVELLHEFPDSLITMPPILDSDSTAYHNSPYSSPPLAASPSLIPLDTPATSKKDLPAVFQRMRQQSGMEDELDELEPLTPNATEQEQIEYKRRQNTLAARQSRKRKLLYQQELEARNDELTEEAIRWRTRCDDLIKLLESHGIQPPSYTD